MIDCRVCKGHVSEFVDLKHQPMANAFVGADGFDDEYRYRLAVGICRTCGMVQIIDEIENKRMFHKDYPYYSSRSVLMQKHFEDVAQRLIDTELSGPDPFVVELGCNDGVMLHTIQEAGIRHFGVEPCDGLADAAASRGIAVLNDYFDEQTAARIHASEGNADVIYAANTFSHISDVGTVLRGVERLLTPEGVFIFEDPYFADILQLMSFDQIYDEHVYFFTATSIDEMARRFGFELADVERLDVHGGELRYTLARPGRRSSPSVSALLAEEERKGLGEPAVLERFAATVADRAGRLVALLEDLKAQGKRVVGYGATAKSATLMNYCGIGPDLISAVYDNTPAKQGRYTPGTHIPVRPVEEFHASYPDYAVLFAWNHMAEIMAKESGFTAAGGKWVSYVPEITVS